ncbi:MAG: cation-transporting P-type ATPase [Acutalibacter sp.]
MKKIVKNVWIAGGSGARGRANTIYERLFWAAAQEETALLARYGTAATGLTPEQVERSREEHGSNVLTYGKRESVAKRLFSAFINPFTVILLALAVISPVTDIALASPGEKNCATVLIIATMVLLSGGLRFVQETRSGNVADKLLGMVVLGYMALVTVVKKRYIRRYGQWL